MPSGGFKRVNPFKRCDFVAYHGTYKKRALEILRTGLRPWRGEIWLSRSATSAFVHAARKAAEEGCVREPVAVLKVRVVGNKNECPVYRPMGHTEAYLTATAIPKDRILGLVPYDERAVAAGIARARKGKRFSAPCRNCPPPRTRKRPRQ